MIIPCELCLIRSICIQRTEEYVICNRLFSSVVKSKRRNIKDKLRILEDIFKLRRQNPNYLSEQPKNSLFLLYETNTQYHYFVYAIATNGRREITVAYYNTPKIPGVTRYKIDEASGISGGRLMHTYKRAFTEEDIRGVDEDTM